MHISIAYRDNISVYVLSHKLNAPLYSSYTGRTNSKYNKTRVYEMYIEYL